MDVAPTPKESRDRESAALKVMQIWLGRLKRIAADRRKPGGDSWKRSKEA